MRGRTTRQAESDAGQKWDWSNSNSTFATFEVTSEDIGEVRSGNDPEDAGEGRVSRDGEEEIEVVTPGF